MVVRDPAGSCRTLLRTRVTNVTKMTKTHAHDVQQARIVVTTSISQRVDTAESVGLRVGC